MSLEDAITSRWDLARVLQPVSPDTFFADSYEARHLAIHREDRDWFSGHLGAAFLAAAQLLRDPGLPAAARSRLEATLARLEAAHVGGEIGAGVGGHADRIAN